MTITLGDIKRALFNGGDVTSFSGIYQQALGIPADCIKPSLKGPLALPETAVMLKQIDENLATLVTGWTEGKSQPFQPEANVNLTLITLPPYGQNTSDYLSRIIDQLKPDIIAIDTPPMELSANLLYSFSLSAALGLPVHGEILAKKDGVFYAGELFYPGNTTELTIIKSWLGKIPLVSAGVPVRKPEFLDADFIMSYVDESYMERELAKSKITACWQNLDSNLGKTTTLKKGIEAGNEVSLDLMKNISTKLREALAEESCYIASRIMEAASIGIQKKRTRLLAITDISHYQDVEHVIGFLMKGITDEIYLPAKSYTIPYDMVMVGRYSEETNKQAKEFTPESSLAEQLFNIKFDEMTKQLETEILEPAEVNRIITESVIRTRNHPDISRGASVRATLAFKEIIGALAEVRRGITRDCIVSSALITLSPRITTLRGIGASDVIRDIITETIYNIHFSVLINDRSSSTMLNWLSPEDITSALKNLEPLTPELGQQNKGLPAVVTEPGQDKELLKHLEEDKFLKREGQNQYSLTRKALEHLLDELEQKLLSGEIEPDEYNQDKDRLSKMLENATQPQFRMPANEMANTIMEIMDAQDRQWGSELGFERMHVYYHIKANRGKEELSPQKRDYYALKTLIDDLEKQGVILPTETDTGFALTGEALDILLEYLITRMPGGKALQSSVSFSKILSTERKHEVRRYSSGDFFRDISVRHTLKEISRQRKDLSNVKRSDFRVFMKQYRQPQSDIVICLDTSASMGPQHKLMYARLVTTGLVKAAIASGDRVGVVTFDNFGQSTIPLTDKDKETIIDYVVRLSARGNTNIGDGIRCATQLLLQDRTYNQKQILLITDGQPTAVSQGVFDHLKSDQKNDLTEESVIVETRMAASKGVKVSVIHIAGKNEASSQFIKDIARYGQGKVRRVGSPEDLETIIR